MDGRGSKRKKKLELNLVLEKKKKDEPRWGLKYLNDQSWTFLCKYLQCLPYPDVTRCDGCDGCDKNGSGQERINGED